MKTAKVFWSGNSQAVRIPKELHIEADEVEIRKRGDTLLLRPKAASWAPLLGSLERFSHDFMKGRRKQPRLDKRENALP